MMTPEEEMIYNMTRPMTLAECRAQARALWGPNIVCRQYPVRGRIVHYIHDRSRGTTDCIGEGPSWLDALNAAKAQRGLPVPS